MQAVAGDEDAVRRVGTAIGTELSEALLDGGVRTLVLDLSGVTFIDSSGLGVLVGVLKRIEEEGDDGGLEIRGLAGPARKVFEITGLHEVFVITE